MPPAVHAIEGLKDSPKAVSSISTSCPFLVMQVLRVMQWQQQHRHRFTNDKLITVKSCPRADRVDRYICANANFNIQIAPLRRTSGVGGGACAVVCLKYLK